MKFEVKDPETTGYIIWLDDPCSLIHIGNIELYKTFDISSSESETHSDDSNFSNESFSEESNEINGIVLKELKIKLFFIQ